MTCDSSVRKITQATVYRLSSIRVPIWGVSPDDARDRNGFYLREIRIAIIGGWFSSFEGTGVGGFVYNALFLAGPRMARGELRLGKDEKNCRKLNAEP